MLYSKSYLISCLKLYKSAKYFEIIYLFLIWSLWCKLLQLELAELDQRYILCRSVWAKLRLLWQLNQCLDDLWASVNLVKAAKYSVIVNFFLYFLIWCEMLQLANLLLHALDAFAAFSLCAVLNSHLAMFCF